MAEFGLSIVIPTLNEEHYVGNLIKDILESSYKDYEIIVSDSGSEDKTLDVVKEFTEKYPNIKLVNASKGASQARNEGAKHAKGDYILFLDSDQRVTTSFIKNSLKEMKERALDIGGFYSKPIKDNFLDHTFWFLCNNLIFRPVQYIYPASSTGSGLFVKKVVHDKINGFDEEIKVIHDHDYVRRASDIGKFRMLNNEKSQFNMRRFNEEGRLSLYFRYNLLIFCFIFKSKKTPVKYDFGKHL